MSAIALADPPPISTTLTPPALTTADYIAQSDLYQLLIHETQHLGRHGATPYRRAAASRVELQLSQLQQQLQPYLTS